jgi:hypothetical protein
VNAVLDVPIGHFDEECRLILLLNGLNIGNSGCLTLQILIRVIIAYGNFRKIQLTEVIHPIKKLKEET